ncbi:RNA polymerase sigma factor [Nocardia sp. CA-128927]|uniref:RNA polymerase sigma factor n=1 Tax=Nocardia sp. CA-128927 TaxID=3239975 RepID=UPI003D9784E0
MTRTDFDEFAVISECLAGDGAAWERLIDRYSAMIWAIARAHRLAAHDCHDVHQSTWMNVLVHLGQLRSPERLSAWIATTARRECLKQIERGTRHLPVGDGADLNVIMMDRGSADAPADAAIRTLDNEAVRAAFIRLPARDQTLLGILMSDSAPNYDTVSAHLGIPRGSIGPLRRRALTRLRNLLPESLVDDAA